MAQTLTKHALTFLLRETLGELVYFPVWWYSVGLRTFSSWLWREWVEVEERLSIRILLKNIGRPMYADYSRSGRIISFFFRIILILVRGFVLLLWSGVELILLLLWVGIPLVAISMLVRQIIPV